MKSTPSESHHSVSKPNARCRVGPLPRGGVLSLRALSGWRVIQPKLGIVEPRSSPTPSFYFAFLFAFFDGGTTPFSGCSLSIGSDKSCSGLSSTEENCGPFSATVKPCAVYIDSLNVLPDFAAATANTPCGTPLVSKRAEITWSFWPGKNPVIPL